MAGDFNDFWFGNYSAKTMKSQTIPLSEIDEIKLQEIGMQIKDGASAVVPTDTIYAIVASAKNPQAVEKIYKLRKRASSKPMIILINSLNQINELGIKFSQNAKKVFTKLWPNPISIVADTKSKRLHFLHRGKKSLAFRMPNSDFLLNLLETTGPLVAPSANFEGEEPARNINQAKKYFNDAVSFYIDNGELKSKPSTVVKLDKNKLKVLRDGAFKIPEQFLK